MVLGIEYGNKRVTFGAGVDYNLIKPRVTTSGTDTKIDVTDECLSSRSYMAYEKYSSGKLMMLLKGFYGQNMTHLTVVCGYGAATCNPETGKEICTNYNGYTALLNITYGNQWKPGLLLGYLGNLGSSVPVANKGGKTEVWG